MATYVYTCQLCGRSRETNRQEVAPCWFDGTLDKRDYRAEGAGFIGVAEMKRQRESGLDGLSGRKAQRDLFLPTAEEMRSPSDPTGQKGIRAWAERHGPRDSNKAPLYPEMDKKVY